MALGGRRLFVSRQVLAGFFSAAVSTAAGDRLSGIPTLWQGNRRLPAPCSSVKSVGQLGRTWSVPRGEEGP
jgi:hypothetical protein